MSFSLSLIFKRNERIHLTTQPYSFFKYKYLLFKHTTLQLQSPTTPSEHRLFHMQPCKPMLLVGIVVYCAANYVRRVEKLTARYHLERYSNR